MSGKKVNTEQMFQSLIKGKEPAPEVAAQTETPVTPAATPAPSPRKDREATPQKERLRQRAFYLTEAQIRAIGLKSVDTGRDKSAIVREALEHYLVEYLAGNKNVSD